MGYRRGTTSFEVRKPRSVGKSESTWELLTRRLVERAAHRTRRCSTCDSRACKRVCGGGFAVS